MTKLIELDENDNPLDSQQTKIPSPPLAQQASPAAPTMTEEEFYLEELNSQLKLDNYWEIDQLPSNFAFYKPYTRIYARPLKILELKMLARMDSRTSDHIINEILRKCVIGIRFEELYEVDKLFIVIWLRTNTFKDVTYDFKFTCPHCESENLSKIGVDQFDIKFLDKGNNTVLEEIELPAKGDKIKIGFSQIKNERFIEAELDRITTNMHLTPEEHSDLKMLVTYAANLISINGVDYSDNNQFISNKYSYLEGLSATDFMKIDGHFTKEENLCGINSFFTVHCEHCEKGKEGLAAPVVFQGSFFTPVV